MSFFDFAWSNSFSITQKDHTKLKVLVSKKYSHPFIGRDEYGYVLYLPKPVAKNNRYTLNGLSFRNNSLDRQSLVRMFASSVHHLSVHTLTSDFTQYKEWAKGKNMNLAFFIVELIEDTAVRAYLKLRFKGLLHDVAYSNALTYLALKPNHAIDYPSLKIQSAIISQLAIGLYKGFVSDSMKRDVEEIIRKLKNFENLLLQSCDGKEIHWDNEKTLIKWKLKLAEKIYDILIRYGAPTEVASFPYTGPGNPNIFHSSIEPDLDKLAKALFEAYKVLGMQSDLNEIMKAIQVSSYKDQLLEVFSAWRAEESRRARLLNFYEKMGKRTEFDEYVFPDEDYAEYLRTFRLYAGTIRHVIDQLRIVRNAMDENTDQEIGILDMQKIIQVIASQKPATDVFATDEYLIRSKAWGILIDSSSSLKAFRSSARAVALCLSEVAKELTTSTGAWGLFSFDSRFSIVKDFSEDYSLNVKSRIGGMVQGRLSYIPDAIKLTANIIRNSGKEANYIFVISDGIPNGYPGIEEKLQKTIKDVENSGVILFGVGIGSKSIKKYFRNSLVVETPAELMKKFIRTYMEISASAV